MKRSPLTLRNPMYGLLVFVFLVPSIAEAANQKPRRQTLNTPIPRTKATGSLKVVTGHQGSVVFINNVRHGVTKENGELDLPRVIAGSYPVRVRTVGYADSNQ